MKCLITYCVLVMAVVVNTEETEIDSEQYSSGVKIFPENRQKKQEKRGIGYSSLGGYTSGLGVDGVLGGVGYNSIADYSGRIGYPGGIGNYNAGYYSPYTPTRVAGLNGFSNYNNPRYYNGEYNAGYNGYGGYYGYSAGYPGAGYSSSRLGYPYARQSYNSYPSSYFNSQLGSSIVGGGVGLTGVPSPIAAGGGYQYGPGISGGIY